MSDTSNDPQPSKEDLDAEREALKKETERAGPCRGAGARGREGRSRALVTPGLP